MEHLKNNRELIEKAETEYGRNKKDFLNSYEDEKVKIQEEINYILDELVDMGFDPGDPEAIPIFIDKKGESNTNDPEFIKSKNRYHELLEKYHELDTKLKKLKTDKELFERNQMN